MASTYRAAQKRANSAFGRIAEVFDLKGLDTTGPWLAHIPWADRASGWRQDFYLRGRVATEVHTFDLVTFTVTRIDFNGSVEVEIYHLD